MSSASSSTGGAAPDHDEIGDEAWWRDYVAGIQRAADTFADKAGE